MLNLETWSKLIFCGCILAFLWKDPTKLYKENRCHCEGNMKTKYDRALIPHLKVQIKEIGKRDL